MGSVEQFHLALALGIEVEEHEDEVIGSLILCQRLGPATDARTFDQLFADAAREVRLQPSDESSIQRGSRHWRHLVDGEVRVARLVTLHPDEGFTSEGFE